MFEFEILKCHASGSDFVLLDTSRFSKEFLTKKNQSALAIQLCDRKGIIGADGCIFIQQTPDGASIEVFAPNGELIGFCINAARCAARFVFENSGKQKQCIILLFPAGTIHVQFLEIGTNGLWRMCLENICGIRTLDKTETERNYVTEFRKIVQQNGSNDINSNLVYGVWLGAPYLFCFSEILHENTLKLLSLRFNANREPSDTSNITFIKDLGDDAIYLHTFERNGIGISQSCDAAAVSATFLKINSGNLKDTPIIKVYSSGGMLSVKWKADERGLSASIHADCSYVYKGKVLYNSHTDTLKNVMQGELYFNEISNYGQFLDKQKSFIREDSFLIRS